MSINGGFQQEVNDCRLRDLGFHGSFFTWERWKGSPEWVEMHLDRVFAIEEWQVLFNKSAMTNIAQTS